MFEFHGWATIRVPGDHSVVTPIGRGTEFESIKKVRQAINQAHDEFSEFDLRKTGNGLLVLTTHGLRNHRYEPVIDLFRWLASELPDSYGLLYIHDDEDSDRDGDFHNEFRAWRLARGKCHEMADPFLSPYFPTVEIEESNEPT